MLSEENLSLYDILKGYFETPGRPKDPSHEGFEGYFDKYDPEDRIRMSILENLTRIFQTQPHMVGHLEGFGVPPDIWKIYSKPSEGPASVEDLVRKTVERYEPRLKIDEVRVQQVEDDRSNSPLSLTVRIVARILGQGDRAILTQFSPAGFEQVTFEEE